MIYIVVDDEAFYSLDDIHPEELDEALEFLIEDGHTTAYLLDAAIRNISKKLRETNPTVGRGKISKNGSEKRIEWLSTLQINPELVYSFEKLEDDLKNYR